MRVLVACESSGVMRRAFRQQGHEAWSCDLRPAEDASPFHYQEDIRAVLQREAFDLVVEWRPRAQRVEGLGRVIKALARIVRHGRGVEGDVAEWWDKLQARYRAVVLLTAVIGIVAVATDMLIAGPIYVSLTVWLWALTIWLIGFLIFVSWPE